jgi:2,4-dienoyl-CoA reductase-like NADH-dependent reductase (Old Yellow Enzyme family)
MAVKSNPLLKPFQLRSLRLKNRFVMAPMTRLFCPEGIPTAEVAAYYQRRAQGHVGLIISEGTVIERPASAHRLEVPRFYGEASLEGWKKVIDGVHEAGGRMAPQIWHMGIGNPQSQSGVPRSSWVAPLHPDWRPSSPFEGPSGIYGTGESSGVAMSEKDIQQTIQAFADAAAEAQRLGFDTVEIHGAHGYLIDEFFWEATNHRRDAYGGKTLGERTRFAVEVVQAIRRSVGGEFPIILRISQFKPTDYHFKLARNPQEMSEWLTPLAQAGVDIFHCSQRRLWEPEFPGSDLNFAGWAKKLTGKASITVGSVGLDNEFMPAAQARSAHATPFDDVVRRFEKGEFDLVAVGRALLTDPAWVLKVEEGRFSELLGFNQEDLKRLT